MIEAPGEGVSTCRSECPNGEFIEGTCDYVIDRQSLQRKIENMEVWKIFESRPHKAVTFFGAESDYECQVWREQNIPTTLPGYSSGKLPGQRKV